MADLLPRILEQVVKVGDIIWDLLGGHNLVLVVSTEKVVYAKDGKNTRFNLSPGDLVKPQWITSRAMASGKREVDYVPREKSLFGFPYAAIGLPLYEDGKIVGAFTITSMQAQQQEVREQAESLAVALSQLTDSSNNLATSAGNLAEHSSVMESATNDLVKNVGAVEEAITLIKDVAEQTHLLGLNAAIEAARAGDQGKGFNVVAAEIRTLAGKVRESVKTIGHSLNCIATGVTVSAQRVAELTGVAQDQAATMQEISTTVFQLRQHAATLERISKQAWI